MKIYGTSKNEAAEMREITFHGSADEIRAVARFLAEKADGMERATFGHAHLRDFCPTWRPGSPDVIVVSDATYPIK